MFGIVHSDERRHQAGRSWIAKALVYTLASTLGVLPPGPRSALSGNSYRVRYESLVRLSSPYSPSSSVRRNWRSVTSACPNATGRRRSAG